MSSDEPFLAGRQNNLHPTNTLVHSRHSINTWEQKHRHPPTETCTRRQRHAHTQGDRQPDSQPASQPVDRQTDKHAHIHPPTQTDTHTHTCVCVCVCAYLICHFFYLYVCVCIYIYIYIYIYLYTLTFMPCTWTQTAMRSLNPVKPKKPRSKQAHTPARKQALKQATRTNTSTIT